MPSPDTTVFPAVAVADLKPDVIGWITRHLHGDEDLDNASEIVRNENFQLTVVARTGPANVVYTPRFITFVTTADLKFVNDFIPAPYPDKLNGNATPEPAITEFDAQLKALSIDLTPVNEALRAIYRDAPFGSREIENATLTLLASGVHLDTLGLALRSALRIAGENTTPGTYKQAADILATIAASNRVHSAAINDLYKHDIPLIDVAANALGVKLLTARTELESGKVDFRTVLHLISLARDPITRRRIHTTQNIDLTPGGGVTVRNFDNTATIDNIGIPNDPETTALAGVVEALGSLEPVARDRVIRYIDSRFL